MRKQVAPAPRVYVNWGCVRSAIDSLGSIRDVLTRMSTVAADACPCLAAQELASGPLSPIASVLLLKLITLSIEKAAVR
jgi:hypothetical protein